jgi:hypothetical protein
MYFCKKLSLMETAVTTSNRKAYVEAATCSLIVVNTRTGEQYSMRKYVDEYYQGWTGYSVPNWGASEFEKKKFSIWYNSNPKPGDYKHFCGFIAFSVNEVALPV